MSDERDDHDHDDHEGQAAAYEALARASAVAGDVGETQAWVARARAAAEAIADPEDREVIEADLANLAEHPILVGT